VMMGHFWFKQAKVASQKLATGGKDSKEFYTSKIQTAEFFFDRLLPRADGHYKGMMATSQSIMQIDKDHFSMA
jgi:Acetyl-CoA dehydrogenase C-terminal like